MIKKVVILPITFFILCFGFVVQAGESDLTQLQSFPPGARDVAYIDRLSNNGDSLYDLLDAAEIMAEAGAGYEAARIAASVALKAVNPSVRDSATNFLAECGLTPEEVLRGDQNMIQHKVLDFFQNRSSYVDQAKGHFRNLIQLNLVEEAKELLLDEVQNLGIDAFESKWALVLLEIQIPPQIFRKDTKGDLDALLVRAHTKINLIHRLPLIWFEDPDIWWTAFDLFDFVSTEDLKEGFFPNDIGKRVLLIYLFYGIMTIAAMMILITLFQLIIRRKKGGKIILGMSAIVAVSAIASVHYLKNVYPYKGKRPYVRWVVPTLPDDPEEEEPPPLDRAAKAEKVLEKALEFTENPEDIQNQAKQLLERLAPHKRPALKMEGTSNLDSESHEESDLFSMGTFHEYELVLSNDAIKSLRKSPKEFVPADFIHKGELISNVGVKLKGGYGSFRIIGGKSKPAFTIKFNHFVKGQRFRGVKRLVLNNSIQDPTYMHEPIAYAIFRDAGLAAPRTGHALLKVNGVFYGLYVQVEAVNKDFLKQWFEDPDGNLFEGPDGLADWKTLELDSNREANDRTRIRQLAETVNQADLTDPWPQLESLIDMPHFARFLANIQFINDWDGFVAMNNYRLYEDPGSGKFYYFPHGLDQTLEDMRHDMFGPVEPVLGRALTMTEKGRQVYREAIADMLDQVWDSKPSLERMRMLYAKIRPYATSGNTDTTLEEFDHEVTQLLEFIHFRRFIVRFQLNEDQFNVNWKNYDYNYGFLDY